MINPFSYLWDLIVKFWYAIVSFHKNNSNELGIFFLLFYCILLCPPVLYIIDILISIIFKILQAIFLTFLIIINWFKNLFKPKIFYFIENDKKIFFQKTKKNELIYLRTEEIKQDSNNPTSPERNEQ
ncbi:hypothetical protein [Candidatus Phytoplasma sp. AldY-WA1]|uniref:hypothetical protein n=1 Tax=Candidatus Phytoplasma sp. AldY-WA1 TaxID=2852100 RepID=UPI00254C2167|nr:hypothetical protein [Candidatus Phytoplasma sp. AldY-WA1]